MGRLAQAGFELVTSADVFPPAMAAKGREFRAMVEYFVGMGASRWGGGEGRRGGGVHASVECWNGKKQPMGEGAEVRELW